MVFEVAPPPVVDNDKPPNRMKSFRGIKVNTASGKGMNGFIPERAINKTIPPPPRLPSIVETPQKKNAENAMHVMHSPIYFNQRFPLTGGYALKVFRFFFKRLKRFYV